MDLELGKSYRAKTVLGDQIRFSVLALGADGWITADLDAADGAEPNVWLNIRLLLWISPESRTSTVLSRATEEVIEALERAEGPKM